MNKDKISVFGKNILKVLSSASKGLLENIHYPVSFLITIFYQEFIISLLCNGKLSLGNLFVILFLPSIALFFTALSGFTSKAAARISYYVIQGALFIIYVSQLIYHKIFGSYYSVSMAGMGGDAMTNFKDAVIAEIIGQFGGIILLLLPVIASILIDLFLIKGAYKRKVNADTRILCLAAFLPVWFLGVLIMMCFGTGRASAFNTYKSNLTDTDTSVDKIGMLSTSIVEAKVYYLGSSSNEKNEQIDTVSIDSISTAGDLFNTPAITKPTQVPTPMPSSTPVVTEAPDQNTVTTPVTTATPTSTPTPTVNPYWINEAIDFTYLQTIAPDDSIASLCKYFESVQPSEKNEYTGLFEGYNLVYICAESFWTYAIDKDATPTLYKMANNGIILDNYYNSFKNTTTNGEFALDTSLWPDLGREAKNGTAVGSFPQSAKNYMPYGLGNLFANIGVNSYAYHNYKGSYYSRNKTLPNLGYKSRFMYDKKTNTGDMYFSSSWITSDYEMLMQSVDDYINEDQFNAYYMTFSGHGPYVAKSGSDVIENDNVVKNLEELEKRIAPRTISNKKANNYLACHIELDRAMEYLLTRLEEAGKLENTVIVIAADHYPYYIDEKAEKALVGRVLNEMFEFTKSTCIIYNAGLKEPIRTDSYCCNVDILPTILNLFNIPFDSRMIMGRDIFAPNINHKAVLYNKSFANDYVMYDAYRDKTTWFINTDGYSKADLDAYLEYFMHTVSAEYAASLEINNTNFYDFVWTNSGLK